MPPPPPPQPSARSAQATSALVRSSQPAASRADNGYICELIINRLLVCIPLAMMMGVQPLSKLVSEEKLLMDALSSVQQKKKRMMKTQRQAEGNRTRRANNERLLPALGRSNGIGGATSSLGTSSTSFPQLGGSSAVARDASRRANTASIGNPRGGDLRSAVRKLDSFMTKKGIRTMDLLRWCSERPAPTRSEGAYMSYISNTVANNSDSFNVSKLADYLTGQARSGALSMSNSEIKLVCKAAARNRKGQIDFKSFTTMLSAKYSSRPQSGQRSNRDSTTPYQRHSEDFTFGTPKIRAVRYSGTRLTSRQSGMFDTGRLPPTDRYSLRPGSAMM
jgi:hypothetical protein